MAPGVRRLRASHRSRPAEPSGRRSLRRGWRSVFGLVVGFAVAMKLTGWFLPLPVPGLGGPVSQCRAAFACCSSACSALVGALAISRPGGPTRSLGSPGSSGRISPGADDPDPVQFLRTIYETPRESLPWYNTLRLDRVCDPGRLLGAGRCGVTGRPPGCRREPIGPPHPGALGLPDRPSGPCRTRRGMTACGFSCRPSGSSPSLGRTGGSVPDRPPRPLGQGVDGAAAGWKDS